LIAKLDANNVNPEKWEEYYKRKDKFLIRFLRANKYDVDKAYEKFLKCIEWRKENAVHNVLWERDNDPKLKQIYESWPICLHKKDNSGMPVLYEKIGPADVKGLFQAYPETKYWVRNHILVHEQTNRYIFTECQYILDRPYQGIIFIEDLQGLGWRHWYSPAIVVMKAVSEMDAQYYPLSVRKLYVINAPSIFMWMWKLVRPWLDPFTSNSMVILGHNFYDVLAKEIPPENIPKEYGGKCDCPNGCLPKAGPFAGRQDDDTARVFVPKKDLLKVPFLVERGNSLKWEFSTINHDIVFGVFYESDDGNLIEVVRPCRYNAHKESVVGTLQVTNPGVYVLIWDNTYSYIRGKNLIYKAHIEGGGRPT